jgi:hypothetical protein
VKSVLSSVCVTWETLRVEWANFEVVGCGWWAKKIMRMDRA